MQSINDTFYCPITYTIMIDPVIGPDGHTYERNAIQQWLSTSNVSPITKQPMSTNNLIPNIALRDTIQSFLSLNPSATNSVKQKPMELNSAMKRNVSIQSKLIENSSLFVRIKADEASVRKPSVFVFVIDVSGSMNTNAAIDTSNESDGFTRLDLVKHSVRTVIEVLNDSDSICLITFSDNAKVVLDITKTNDFGKSKAIQVLENIRTEGMTNIWDGLRVALLNVEKVTDPNVNISVVLLTDGEPNQNPPRGIVPTLKSTIESRKINQSFTINTFGYGYSLDSKLLIDISECGSGSYGYIPDSSMVGTIFVNYLSNVLATCLSNSTINFICDDPNVTIITKDINIGSILYDQPRELIYKIVGLTKQTQVKINLVVANQIITTCQVLIEPDKYNLDSSCLPTMARYKIMNTLNNVINNTESSNNLSRAGFDVKSLYDEIAKFNDVFMSEADSNKIKAYMQDYISSDVNIGGQISKAFVRTDWFTKWGRHFARSIMNAYYYQQCNNFKDPGVQLFAGNLFNQIRVIADDAFCMLPPPKPSGQQYSYNSRTSSVSNTSQTHAQTSAPSMASYYDRGGSCFDADGNVTMFSENIGEYYLPVKSLVKGQTVKTIINNQIATTKVRCVIKSAVPNRILSMCKISKMLITPWHPIISNGQWVFPINVAEETLVRIDYIYNIVLESGHVLFINNCPVVTLGHNFSEPIVAHAYYGSQEIIKDLSEFSGWIDGLVILPEPMTLRTNGIVTKLFSNSKNNATIGCYI
jgi:Mg-chelatase subunit ChlD